MTRAKTELYLTYATSRLLYGGQQHNPPSRFLKDIKAEVEVDNVSNAQLWQTHLEDQIQKPLDGDDPIYIPELYEGDMVRHKIFCEGRVGETEVDNLVIYFKNHGTKKINLNFAPIEKIND